MTPVNPDRGLNLDDPGGCALLGNVFLRAGYRHEDLSRLLGTSGDGPAPILDTAVCSRRLCDDSPLATLVRLFQLRDSVSDATASAALAPLDLARVQSMGLIEVNGGATTARFTVTPLEGLLVASDWIPADRSSMPAACVPGISAPTVRLAQLTIRRPVEAALDLGTGTGVHALLAAQHAGHVVATDINPRALNVTAFNALLNGVANIECRHGSFFDAVDGETFDFISTNPPFVISPDARYLYRDGDRSGDGVCADLLCRLPDYLRDGGIGHLLGNWACHPAGDWTDPLRRWLRNRGCDVLALLHHVDDPLTYAARWLQPVRLAHPDDYGHALDRWLAYHRACGIDAIASGAVVVRKRRGANWFQGFAAEAAWPGFCGEHLHRLLSIQDYCADHLRTPDDILDCRLELREHRLEQVFHFERGQYHLHAARLRLHESVPRASAIDEFGLQILLKCDGRQTVRDVLREVAARHEINVDDMIQPAVASIADLVARGILLPVELRGVS